MASSLDIRVAQADPLSLTHPAPKNQDPMRHIYYPSDDGTDENILILLHGLGDTHLPFANLGKKLCLPQTATLSLRAPEKVPYLYEEAYQWYESFDPLGELLPRPNPTPALELMDKFLNHLVGDCHWPPWKIHFFGFGQGGSLAAEIGLRWWRDRSAQNLEARLGSIVSVAGPLLSYPTPTTPCTTPLMIFHRPESEGSKLSEGDLRAFKRGYTNVQEITGVKEGGMPRSREEWEPIMRFWSTTLSKRTSSGLYEVLGGISS